MSKLYLEILDPKRKNVFEKLSAFKKDGVLAGGTALALQIKHRQSFDFDVFLPKPISRPFFRKVAEAFGENLKTRVSTGDISAAHTIGRRGQWRDYVDIFFLLKRKIFTLEDIVEMAERKYRSEFNPRLFLEQLTYYGDIQDFSVSFLGEPYTVDEIKDFLTASVKDPLLLPAVDKIL